MQTILVVDDEFGVAEVLEATLADEGYRVLTATDGRGALAILAQSRPDAVLLDYMMPVMDGVAMLRTIQADPALRHVPVVMMSALPEVSIRSQVEGYAGFLRKPFKIKALLTLMSKVLSPPA